MTFATLLRDPHFIVSIATLTTLTGALVLALPLLVIEYLSIGKDK